MVSYERKLKGKTFVAVVKMLLWMPPSSMEVPIKVLALIPNQLPANAHPGDGSNTWVSSIHVEDLD